jgi:hypothetical protein
LEKLRKGEIATGRGGATGKGEGQEKSYRKERIYRKGGRTGKELQVRGKDR